MLADASLGEDQLRAVGALALKTGGGDGFHGGWSLLINETPNTVFPDETRGSMAVDKGRRWRGALLSEPPPSLWGVGRDHRLMPTSWAHSPLAGAREDEIQDAGDDETAKQGDGETAVDARYVPR
jgi:hypothetical protein